MNSPAAPVPPASARAFLGHVLHSPTRGQLEYLPGAQIEVEGD